MKVDTDNIIPATKFRANLSAYIKQVNETGEPICVTQNGEVAGIFIGKSAYERVLAEFVEQLLESRKTDKLIPHDEVASELRAFAAKTATKNKANA